MATTDPRTATEGQWSDLVSRIKTKADTTDVPTITMSNTDPGEGTPLAANNFIGVYGGDPIILDYSLVEVNTGSKWIDGSPIYKKTINIGTLPNNTTKSVPHNISNLNRIIRFEGYAHRPSDAATFPIPYSARDGAYNISVIQVGASIAIGTGMDRSDITECYATLYYTKSS